jgi:colanic acid/amylovoran biosynthesis protein WcaK/AmsJ
MKDVNMNKSTINILINNSHADNRGDEVAQRNMINVLKKLIPDARFTVVTTSPIGLQLQKEIEVLKFVAHSKKFPFFTLPFVILWLVFKVLGIELSSYFRKYDVFKALARTARADLVISAPGGPYFGDLYRRHEIGEHLLNILVAKLFKKPVMIYGPSMGPFSDTMAKCAAPLSS